MSTLPDQQERDRIRTTRNNVVVTAGAGTGKTHTLIQRILELVDPADSEQDPVPIDRIAAITFTRKAAGEIKSRLRSNLLDRIASARNKGKEEREERLVQSLRDMNRAFIGTIHAVADRLLRKRPLEGRISPKYSIVEDEDDMVDETIERFLAAVRQDRFTDYFPETDQEILDRAKRVVLSLLNSGVPERDTEHSHGGGSTGLESLFQRWIAYRDETQPKFETPSTQEADDAIPDLIEEIEGFEHSPEKKGYWFFKEIQKDLQQILEEADRTTKFENINSIFTRSGLSSQSYGYDPFGSDEFASNDQKTLWLGLKGVSEEDLPKFATDECHFTNYREKILKPYRRWIASKLLEVRPLLIKLYEEVKREYAVLDQTDLLIKLRDALRENREVREEMKNLFSHILVDEFQDTDPIQVEIVFFLAEQMGDFAEQWNDVTLRENVLTLVGDPKQSIFRFRRADIETFHEAVTHMMDQGADQGRLQTNFRSGPQLIDFYNTAFRQYLGEPEKDEFPYDPEEGEARYTDVLEHPEFHEAAGQVRVLRYQGPSTKPDRLEREAEVVGDYLQYLASGESGPDVRSGPPENPSYDADVSYGDMAILGRSTGHFHRYLREFSRRNVPVVVSGGSTFLEKHLNKKFVLALRAIADPSDGPAQVALQTPPFFPLDFGDLMQKKVYDDELQFSEERKQRYNAAWEVISALRRKRFDRPPLETALDLIDRSLLDRHLAARPSGNLDRLDIYHIATRLDHMCRRRGWDYDQATEQMRDWVSGGPGINGPTPVEADAVQMMTIHQAKGLEFPVVVLFDAEVTEKERLNAYDQTQDGSAVYFNISNFDGVNLRKNVSEPLTEKEKRMGRGEEKRLFYVAATRARDHLVVPQSSGAHGGCVYQQLLNPVRSGDGAMVVESDKVGLDEETPWSEHSTRDRAVDESKSEDRDERVEESLRELSAAVQDARENNIDVSSVHDLLEASGEEDVDVEEVTPESARHGPAFGRVVHHALHLAARSGEGDSGAAEKWVDIARAAEPGEIPAEDQLVSDVENGLRTLHEEKLLEGVDAYPEYPVVGRRTNHIVRGKIDLLLAKEGTTWIIDHKTDPAPDDADDLNEQYPEYVHQLQIYREILTAGDADREVKTALLFTETGSLREVRLSALEEEQPNTE